MKKSKGKIRPEKKKREKKKMGGGPTNVINASFKANPSAELKETVTKKFDLQQIHADAMKMIRAIRASGVVSSTTPVQEVCLPTFYMLWMGLGHDAKELRSIFEQSMEVFGNIRLERPPDVK